MKKTVSRIERRGAALFIVCMVLFIAAAISCVVIFVNFHSDGTVITLLFMFPGIVIMLACLPWIKKGRSKEMQVYFIKMPVIKKEHEDISSANDTVPQYKNYLIFENHKCLVLGNVYGKTNIGDQFYLMINKADGSCIGCYKETDYELAPSMDLRD